MLGFFFVMGLFIVDFGLNQRPGNIGSGFPLYEVGLGYQFNNKVNLELRASSNRFNTVKPIKTYNNIVALVFGYKIL